MKSGFYLRPDGEEIIEIPYSWSDWVSIKYYRINNRRMSYDMQVVNVRITYGNWIYLGV